MGRGGLRSGPGPDCEPVVPKSRVGKQTPRARCRSVPVSGGCLISGSVLASKSINREGRGNLFSGPGLSKTDFQDLTAKLLLDIKRIQPEAREGLDSPCSMEENTHSRGLQFPVLTLWPEG